MSLPPVEHVKTAAVTLPTTNLKYHLLVSNEYDDILKLFELNKRFVVMAASSLVLKIPAKKNSQALRNVRQCGGFLQRRSPLWQCR